METLNETYLVKGCGVSFICHSREDVKARCSEIIDKGGVPEVQRWAGSTNG